MTRKVLGYESQVTMGVMVTPKIRFWWA